MANVINCITVKNDFINLDSVLSAEDLIILTEKIISLKLDTTKFKTYANSRFFEYYPCVVGGQPTVALLYKKNKYLLPNECMDYNAFVLYVDALAAKLITTTKDSSVPKTEM